MSAKQSVIDGTWPGVTHRDAGLPGREAQCEACEYAGCICIVVAAAIIAVVVIAITKTRLALLCF